MDFQIVRWDLPLDLLVGYHAVRVLFVGEISLSRTSFPTKVSFLLSIFRSTLVMLLKDWRICLFLICKFITPSHEICRILWIAIKWKASNFIEGGFWEGLAFAPPKE